jgi:anti-sigma regulatory factor (Ser/Thr protein kinase)
MLTLSSAASISVGCGVGPRRQCGWWWCQGCGRSLQRWQPKRDQDPLVSTLNARVDLRPTPNAVRAARRLVSELLTGWDADRRGADVALLVSEVVTNAVDHAGGEASLELSLSQGWLRVSLADGSSIRPQIRELDPTDSCPRGRGMRLVERIAHRWAGRTTTAANGCGWNWALPPPASSTRSSARADHSRPPARWVRTLLNLPRPHCCCGVGGARSRGQSGTPTMGAGRRTRPPAAERSGSGSAGRNLATGPGWGRSGVGWSWLGQFAAMIASNSARSRSRSPHTTSANSAILGIASSIGSRVSTSLTSHPVIA